MTMLISIIMYFLPTIVAGIRQKRNSGAVFITNVIFGWTLIGWGISLIWACCQDKENVTTIEKPKLNIEKESKSVFSSKDKKILIGACLAVLPFIIIGILI